MLLDNPGPPKPEREYIRQHRPFTKPFFYIPVSILECKRKCNLGTPCLGHKLLTGSECTTVVHRCSLAVFHRRQGIAAVRIIFPDQDRRENRPSLAIFNRKEIVHLGALRSRDFW